MTQRLVDDPTLLEALVRVAEEYLGPDHECIRALRAAQQTGDAKALAEAEAALWALRDFERQHVTREAKRRLNDGP